MDATVLEDRFLTAGKEYADALRSLGLDPHALLWAFDKTENRHVLVLVTDFFDLKGPYEISQKLFQAYNASVTPQAIDPFVVRLHSTKQKISAELMQFAGTEVRVALTNPDGSEHDDASALTPVFVYQVNDLAFRPNWVIALRKTTSKPKVADVSRKWDRFVRNVDKAAA